MGLAELARKPDLLAEKVDNGIPRPELAGGLAIQGGATDGATRGAQYEHPLMIPFLGRGRAAYSG